MFNFFQICIQIIYSGVLFLYMKCRKIQSNGSEHTADNHLFYQQFSARTGLNRRFNGPSFLDKMIIYLFQVKKFIVLCQIKNSY